MTPQHPQRRRSAWYLTAVAAALVLALPLPSARAHGAEGLAYQGVSGPYLISVFDGRAVEGSDLAEYRVVLTQDPKDGQLGAKAPLEPVPGARVIVTDATGAHTTAEGIGNVYFFSLAAVTQAVKIAVQAAPGHTLFEVEVHGIEGSDSAVVRRRWPSPGALAAVGVGALLLIVFLMRRRRA